jgi:hypothetical protein
VVGSSTLARARARAGLTRAKERCRRHFLEYFPQGFRDKSYRTTERAYKAAACAAWQKQLGSRELQSLARRGCYREVAARAVAIESTTNLLFSFEKMALRDAVRSASGSRRFAEALLGYASRKPTRAAFEAWVEAIAKLPRRQTRVLTWPLVTVFGFFAQPRNHIFLKPRVTQRAALAYGYPFDYAPRPNWGTYASLLDFAREVRRDLSDLGPRDMIDVQSFLWVQGSEEYP